MLYFSCPDLFPYPEFWVIFVGWVRRTPVACMANPTSFNAKIHAVVSRNYKHQTRKVIITVL